MNPTSTAIGLLPEFRGRGRDFFMAGEEPADGKF